VTGGGVSDDGNHWHPARNGFLVPLQALANLVGGKLRAALSKRRPDLTLPKATWAKPWVVDCTAWGEGHECVLRYLARYVFRVAITNNRIVGLDDKCVTLRYKDRKSMQWRTARLSGHEFMRRFLQHVLPRGLHKVRYYGLWHPARRENAERARHMILLDHPAKPFPATRSTETADRAADRSADHATSDEIRICPCCQQGCLVRAARLYPKQASGP
jgi:Putative transposase